jgi:Protein of unknown function (DUF3307)
MADPTLVLAWLVLAHLGADFVFQTETMVADKFTAGRRAWRGLLIHAAAVAICLVPVALAFGTPGLVLLVVVTVAHMVIDRWKVRATRRAEGRALADAHRRHEAATSTGLGPAWTPIPGALFVLDQLAHAAVIGTAWLVLLAYAPVAPAFMQAVDRVVGGMDRAALHHGVLIAVVLLSLAIVNVRAGALFVATLVRPREAVTGERVPEEPTVSPAAPKSWRLRLGGLVATAEPVTTPSDAATAASTAPPARIGATIGVLERLLIVTFVLTGSSAAVGFVVAAKTLARFRQLDDRDFAEYYLLGTLASVSVAVGSGLLGAAALGTVP